MTGTNTDDHGRGTEDELEVLTYRDANFRAKRAQRRRTGLIVKSSLANLQRSDPAPPYAAAFPHPDDLEIERSHSISVWWPPKDSDE